MSTNSTIAVKLADGSVNQVYCHWDGYLEHNGVILQKHYNSQELAEALVNLGDISFLCKNINPDGEHTFDNPKEGVTIFYGRDRGESGVNARKFWNEEMFRLSGEKEEYDYLFADGEWLVRFSGKKWVPLIQVLNRVVA